MQAKALHNAEQSKQDWKVFNAPMGKELRTKSAGPAFGETGCTIQAPVALAELQPTARSALFLLLVRWRLSMT